MFMFQFLNGLLSTTVQVNQIMSKVAKLPYSWLCVLEEICNNIIQYQ